MLLGVPDIGLGVRVGRQRAGDGAVDGFKQLRRGGGKTDLPAKAHGERVGMDGKAGRPGHSFALGAHRASGRGNLGQSLADGAGLVHHAIIKAHEEERAGFGGVRGGGTKALPSAGETFGNGARRLGQPAATAGRGEGENCVPAVKARHAARGFDGPLNRVGCVGAVNLRDGLGMVGELILAGENITGRSNIARVPIVTSHQPGQFMRGRGAFAIYSCGGEGFKFGAQTARAGRGGFQFLHGLCFLLVPEPPARAGACLPRREPQRIRARLKADQQLRKM